MYIDEGLLSILIVIMGWLLGSILNMISIFVLQNSSVHFCNKCRVNNDNHYLFLSSLLLGRCRLCKSRISPLYPIGEIVTTLLVMLYVYKIGWKFELLVGLVFVAIMVIIVYTDLRRRIIPNRIILIGLWLIIPIRLFITHTLPLWDYLLAGLLVGFLLYGLAVASKGGIGGGDIKLFFLIGFFIGLKATLLTLFAASLLGYLFGAMSRLLRRKKDVKVIPFGPFIAFAGLFAYLWGDQLFDWYWGLFIN